jgi:hypothetical protein
MSIGIGMHDVGMRCQLAAPRSGRLCIKICWLSFVHHDLDMETVGLPVLQYDEHTVLHSGPRAEYLVRPCLRRSPLAVAVFGQVLIQRLGRRGGYDPQSRCYTCLCFL